jgi:hypothetical protein
MSPVGFNAIPCPIARFLPFSLEAQCPWMEPDFASSGTPPDPRHQPPPWPALRASIQRVDVLMPVVIGETNNDGADLNPPWKGSIA